METKKTIIVSIITTLATMFVVAVLIHLCCGNCGGRSSCKIQSSQCEKSMKCEMGSKCDKASKCDMKKSCNGKACEGKSSCDKGIKTMEWTSEDGKQVIKKEITVDVVDKK